MIRHLSFAALIAGILGGVAQADTLSITDGVASFVYRTDDAAGTSGNSDLTVAALGGSDIGFDEAWFVQRGGSAEELLAGFFTPLGPDAGSVIFTTGDGLLEVEVIYTIEDLGPGPGDHVASLGIEATVTNLGGGGTISGDLVNFLDWDLPDADPDAGFFLDLGTDIVTGVDDVPFNGFGNFADRFYEAADGGEIDDAGTLLASIAGGSTLGRTDNGFIDGDYGSAGGWSFTLDELDSVTFFADSFVAVTPEPSAFLGFCLVSVGGLLARRRRKLTAV